MTDFSPGGARPALIESILERGFDPEMPVNRGDFLRFVADAEAIDIAGPRALPPEIAQMGRQFGEIGSALMLPVAVGQLWLARLLETTRVTLEESAITNALMTLIRRLVPVLQQIVQFETLTSRSAGGINGDHGLTSDADQPLLNAWLERWQTFPVLGSLVTLTLVGWIRALEEMIRALEHDYAALAATISRSSTPLTIRSVHGDAGDPHLGGRSVMILTFADGAQVVFKPKQLAITDVFRTLVDKINSAGYSTPLRAHDAIVRDRHTWEAYVPHRSCDSDAQVERFYRRMGGWIRLLQILEGRDFWLDNLIADGEYPIFIDLETIMQPRRRNMEMSLAAERAQDRIESSPLVTNIVAMAAPIGPGIGGEDLGCFAPPKEFLSPFPATGIPGAKSSGTSRDGYRTWTHPEHAPMLNGQPVPADLWFEAIETGYREMAMTIDGRASELLEPGGLIEKFCEHPVRTIFRDTWTCIRIIHRSTAPPLLGSYRRRRQFLERMDRGVSDGETRTGQVIAAEARAMVSLDVPFFTAYGNDDAIHPPDDPAVPAFFDATARERVVANLRDFSPQRLDEDASLLRTSFWTAHPETPAVSTTGRPTAALIEIGAWQAAARRIADDIAAARMTSEDGTSSWIALTYHPTSDIQVLSPIGNDLLSGRAGLVLFFSDMWQTSRIDRWREIAIESAYEVAGALRQLTGLMSAGSSTLKSRQADPSVLLGAFTGIGGMLATVKLASETLGEPELESAWRDTLDAVPWRSALARSHSDVVGGSIGLGLALTGRPEWMTQFPSELRESLEHIAQRADVRAATVYPPGAVATLASLPGERVAQLLIRSRLGAVTTLELEELIPALLESDPAIGDLLGIITLSGPDTPWWQRLSELVREAAETLGSSANRTAQLDSAVLALAMWRSSAGADWHERARSLGERWIADFNESGSWFPADLADDKFRLSIVRGVPAIASVLLGIGGTPTLFSPLTLDWRIWEPQ